MKRFIYLILLGLVGYIPVYAGELGSGLGVPSYPTTLDTDIVLESTDTYAREDVPNDSNAAIIKLEVTIGTNPTGNYTTVGKRLDAIEGSTNTIYGLHNSSFAAAGLRFLDKTISDTCQQNLIINGNLGIQCTPTTALTVGNNRNIYFVDHCINSEYESANNGGFSFGEIGLNYEGFHSATDYFRDVTIYDGKRNKVLSVDGSSSRVGIGIDTPMDKLQVIGNISNSGLIFSSGTGNNYFAGNVGIGTAIPTSQLTIKQSVGTIAGGLQLISSDVTNSGGIFREDTSGGSIIIRNGGLNTFSVATSGNVGIGITNPTQKLEINGNLTFSTSAQYLITYDTVYSTQAYRLQVTNGILTINKQ